MKQSCVDTFLYWQAEEFDTQEKGNVNPLELDGVFEMLRRIGGRNVLFDQECTEYRDRNKAAQAWKEVARDLKVGEWLKNLIQGLNSSPMLNSI